MTIMEDRQTGIFRLEDLQVVPDSAERLAAIIAAWDSGPPLRIGEAVRHVMGGATMLVVDFLDTFDSPGVERDLDGIYQPLPSVASILITTAWKNKLGEVVEDELYRESLVRVSSVS